MCKCSCFSICFYFVFRSLVGMCLKQSGIDSNITLEKSRFLKLKTSSIPMILRFILRHIFELLNFSHLLSFHLFVASTTIWTIGPSPISSFRVSHRRHSLIRLNSAISEAPKILLLLGRFLATLASRMLSRIVLFNGQMPVDILKKIYCPL